MPKTLERHTDSKKEASKKNKSSEVNRVHVSYPPSMKKKLEEIKKDTEKGSLSEVFRQALMFYALAFEEHKKGSDFIIRDKNGNMERLRMFF